MAKTTHSDKSAPASFEAALREIESIVAAMEEGDLDLDPSLKAYQRGMELLKFCQDKLTDAENKIRVFDQGKLSELKPGDFKSGDADAPDAD
jgi:exodeoxyribonuclease VII small subunit